ncbi:ABC transporter ATP-binding protein [Leptolyngbya sp. FACHB-541]|uniref:ABC transporter ATP-binding protein n=1 Tax=Leptolyngbya sp. FACHB-541 TaxID=2692810 RepID=UPI00168934C4|nr:ABC transporter ATP-binding protein [Leptolyngbya sp. FACHB-541]MBD1997001.1 ABC transporter ATP-binding protein [Leptolyngbya sp. FACHB-541]
MYKTVPHSQSLMPHLHLQDLTKHFPGVTAVQSLWLEVQAGEILALLGPSGCGKSTTLQMIAGVVQPDSGTITLDGQILNRVPPERRDIALVLQRGLLFPHLTVGENVAFGLKMRGVGQAEREEKAIAMLRQVQLEGFAYRKPAELSGGQAQRVALARSLIIHPKLLLLDEPLSALDANLREEMQDLILRLQAQMGVTMLIVTHDQAEAVVMSRRIALMFDGCLRQVDTPEQIYQQPCDETVARFMGGVNFFAAEAHGRQWTLSNDLTLLSEYDHYGSIQVTIRPEQIQVFIEGRSQANTLPATVIANRFTGTQRRLTLAIAPELTLQAWVTPTQDFQIGQFVWTYLPPTALWYFPHSTVPHPVQVS